MGKSWGIWCLVLGTTNAIAFAACGADDTTTPEEAGVDASARDARGSDAAVADASDMDGQADAACYPCGYFIGNGLNPLFLPACPESLVLYEDLVDCACNVDVVTNEAGAGKCDIDSGTGDAGEGACKDFCPYAARKASITNACVQCELDHCRLEFFACFHDGMDAGDGG